MVSSGRCRYVAAALSMLLTLGCGSCPQRPSPARSAAVLDEVEAIAAAAREARAIPGIALAALRGEEVLLARGYGLADPQRGEPVSARTVFQLGSISKTFLAALVVRLAEQGRLSLDDPVSRHLPGFEGLPSRITLRHLLAHTSGIREPFTLPEYQAGIGDLARRPEEMVAILKRTPVDFPAGARWSYSNANYMILALAVERITGQSYEQALSDGLFRPLGLTSLRPCTPLPERPDEARGHVLDNGAAVPAAPENMGWIRGDGGLCGHALDVASWFGLLASGRVVAPESYRAMTTPARLAGGREADYGLGLSLVALDGRPKVAHNGAMLGFSASAAHYPDDRLTVVVLTNRGDVRTETIERRIARRLLGLPAPDLAALPLSPEARRRFVGGYDIGVFAVHIRERGDRLWLEMPPPGPTTPLRYLGDGDLVSDADPDAYRLTFSGNDGPATELRLLMGAMHWYGIRLPEPVPSSSPPPAAPAPLAQR